MKNLLKETEEMFAEYGKTWEDVKGICLGYYYKYWDEPTNVSISVDQFIKVADRLYDNGFGGQEVNKYLMIIGDDWWMERHEYDGSEWWEYKTLPNLAEYPKVDEVPNWYVFSELRETEEDYYD